MVQQLACISQFEIEPSRAAQAKPGGGEPRFKITGKLSKDHKDDCAMALGIAMNATILRQATRGRFAQ